MDNPVQNQVPNPGFTLRPGDGWLFHQKSAQGTHLFQGHMAITDSETYQVVGKLNEAEGKYEFDVRKFGGTWPTVAHFDLPQIKDAPFVEGELNMPYPEPIEVQGMKIKSRKLKVRAFRGTTREGEPVLRIRLPQIQRAQGPANQVIP